MTFWQTGFGDGLRQAPLGDLKRDRGGFDGKLRSWKGLARSELAVQEAFVFIGKTQTLVVSALGDTVITICLFRC